MAHERRRGLTDRDALNQAVRDRRILVTEDADFAERIYREGLRHTGVMLLRLRGADAETKAAWIDHVAKTYPDRLGDYIVISHRGVRIRTRRP